MILLDTSGVLAWVDADQRLHQEVREAMGAVAPPYLLSPFILAELDYLLGTTVGSRAQHQLLREVADGAYRLEPFDATDVERALEVLVKYADLDIGLADASLVVLSERHRTRDLLTLDERHFRVVRGVGGKPFRLFPSDV